MRISAGIVLIYKNQILLVQQKNDIHQNFLSIPKGGLNENESPAQAAIRETYEETGIRVEPSQIDIENPFIINSNNSKLKRRIIYYVVNWEKPKNPIISVIDRKEIIWAGFVSLEEAQKRLQISQQSILMHVNSSQVNQNLLDWLLLNKYIRKEKHYNNELYSRK